MAGISEFMDSYSGDGLYRGITRGSWRGRSGRLLADAGPNCDRIARAAPTARFGEQMLSSLFWWCYVRTDNFAEALEISGLREIKPGHRQIIASHAEGTRFDLLILAPEVRAPRGVTVTPDRSYARSRPSPRDLPSIALSESENMLAMLARAGIRVDARVAVIAVAELARYGDFRVVVAAPPEETPTGAAPQPGEPGHSFLAPASALPVTFDDEPRAVATAGVIATGDGGLLVTTARHVIETAAARSAKIMVGGMPASVVGQPDLLTDSCVLAVGCAVRPGAGAAGPLRRPPVLYMPASFAGAASGPTQTKIISFDMSVVSPTPHSGGRVYTDPDTIPGDSGAALIDSDDHLVGFAVGRTAFGAPIEFSTWSWAEQVLTAHQLA
jgi:hypothetical protein